MKKLFLKMVAVLLFFSVVTNIYSIDPIKELTTKQFKDLKSQVEPYLQEFDNDTFQAFFNASIDGRSDVIRFLVQERGINVDMTDVDNATALFYSVSSGQIGVINTLIELNADVNHKDVEGETALFAAIENYQNEALAILITAGTNIYMENFENFSPFVFSQELENYEAAEIIKDAAKYYLEQKIQKLDEGINYQNTAGDTLLHIALKKDKNLEFTLLVEMGINLDIQNKYGLTALALAVVYKNKNIVEFLLEKGADPNEGVSDKLPLIIAFKARFVSYVIVNKLLDGGADPNSQDSDGLSPLHYATNKVYDKDLVSNLLEKKADPNLKEKYGNTPLHYAVDDKNVKVILMLISFGADKTIKNKDGITPEDIANSIKENQEILKALEPKE